MPRRFFEQLARGRGLRRIRRTIDQASTKASTKHRRRERARRAPDVVTIEYSPSLDGDPDPGEIVWTHVPYEDDPRHGKDRPVVVIGRRGDRLVAVPLTTKRSDREAQVPVGTGAWDSKRRNSFARVCKLLEIDPDRMRREGAVLGPDVFGSVVRAVDEYYDVRLPSDVVSDTDADA